MLVIHLVLYPWPAIIPDLQDAHNVYSKQRGKHQPLPQPRPTPPSPYAP